MATLFTKHAEEMLGRRKISKEKVIECLTNPDIKEDAKFGKKAYYKDFGINYLKVVVLIELKNVVVITTHWVEKRRIKH